MATRSAGVAGSFALLLAGILCSLPGATAEESCAVSGRVMDEWGKPIPFAAVSTVCEPSSKVGSAPLLVVNGAAANQRGEYCIRELPPGEYLIRATARMHPPSASPACDSCCRSNVEFATAFHQHSRSPEHAN
jgi:hypothetical protein